MKKNIILISTVAALLIVMTVVLANNKSKMDSRISRDSITAYPVNVTEVSLQTVSHDAEYVGAAAAINDVEVLSETQGRVLAVMVSNGARVSKGTAIAQVENEMLKAQYTLAESALDKAKKDVKRYENLFAEGNLSINELENARVNVKNAEAQFIIAKKSLENTRITSPISGTITKRHINIGSTLVPGAPVANIVDISKLKVTIPVPEKDLGFIRADMKVKVSSDLYPGKDLSGKVTCIGIKADDSHNYPVEVTINNSDHKLNAGMFIKINLLFTAREEAIIIPRSALMGSARDGRVFIVKDGTAYMKNITVTRSAGDKLEVKGSINPGDKIVVSGQNNLEDSTKVFIRGKVN